MDFNQSFKLLVLAELMLKHFNLILYLVKILKLKVLNRMPYLKYYVILPSYKLMLLKKIIIYIYIINFLQTLSSFC